VKRLLALHARTGALFQETKEHVASESGAAVLEDEEVDVKPAVSASGLAAMPREAVPQPADDDDDDLSLMDWRGRRV
jgi:hypothetical protein